MKQSKKKVVDAEEGIVIIHDELAECESADPTFGGMREGARLEEIYKEIKAKTARSLQRTLQTPATKR
jgi:hypothetical protein